MDFNEAINQRTRGKNRKFILKLSSPSFPIGQRWVCLYASPSKFLNWFAEKDEEILARTTEQGTTKVKLVKKRMISIGVKK